MTEQEEVTETFSAENDAQDSMNRVYIIGGCILAGAILIAGTIYYCSKTILKHMDDNSAAYTQAVQQAQNVQAQAPAAPTAPNAQAAVAGPVNIKLASGIPYLGSGTAKVTVVEFADYRCPFCERFYTSVMPQLKSKYIDSGKIKFVYQDFAFLGPDSNTAAEASHCAADQNKFWQYHDYLFSNQGSESTDWASAINQKIFAKTLGLNVAQFSSCLDSGKYKQEVLNETAAGKQYGVTGTPTVFVNGVAIVGAQPLETFTQAIDAALK